MTTLLPPNRTTLEVELERALHRVEGIDVDALRRMRDPYQCSMDHLPALAWGRGVDLWYDDWPEWKKRRITAEICLMKGRKGTLPGIDKYLSYVDAKIIEFVIPPRSIIARRQDSARIKAWRDRFAEIRLYTVQARGRRPGVTASWAGNTALSSPGRAIARPTTGNYGRRSVLVDRGVEIEIRSFEQIKIEGGIAVPTTTFAIRVAGRSTDAVSGRAIVGRMVAGPPRGRLIVIGAGRGGSSVPPGFTGVETLDVTPERVRERHSAKAWQPVASASPNVIAGKMIARENQAPRHAYASWRLLDPERAGGVAYQALPPIVGRMVPSLPAFTGLLRIDARYRKAGAPNTVGSAVGRVVARPPHDRILRIGAAIYRSRAVRDDVFFTTRTHRPLTLADLSFDAPVPFSGMVPVLGAVH